MVQGSIPISGLHFDMMFLKEIGDKSNLKLVKIGQNREID